MASGLRNLRFACSNCGHCCRSLRVPITDSDLRRLQSRTSETPDKLVAWLAPDEVDMTGEPESFVTLREGRRLMTLAQRENACRFVTEDNRCSVHDARPRTCQMYPFDLKVGRRGGIHRLRLLQSSDCEYTLGAKTSAHELASDDNARWTEHREFIAKVARFNRLQLHRERLGRLPQDANAFFVFLGVLGA